MSNLLQYVVLIPQNLIRTIILKIVDNTLVIDLITVAQLIKVVTMA